MPTSVGKFKAGRIALSACMGIVGIALAVSSAPAQQSGHTEVLRTPTEKNFLNPGPVSSDRKGPGYVVDGLITSPAYGPSDKFGGNLLPPAIGGGQPLIGGDSR